MPSVYKLPRGQSHEVSLRDAAQEILQRSGKTFVYPTETIYGLGAVYSDTAALEKIFALKGRIKSRPVLLLIPNVGWLFKLTRGTPSQNSLALAKRFWPGPLTLLFAASPALPALLIGSGARIGCRISSLPAAGRLVDLLGCPIVSTSANFSGGRSPACLEDVPGKILESVDVVIDGGATPGEQPSTVVDVSAEPFKVVREGAVPVKDLNLQPQVRRRLI